MDTSKVKQIMEKIKTAIYAKDVRNNIADGIEELSSGIEEISKIGAVAQCKVFNYNSSLESEQSIPINFAGGSFICTDENLFDYFYPPLIVYEKGKYLVSGEVLKLGRIEMTIGDTSCIDSSDGTGFMQITPTLMELEENQGIVMTARRLDTTKDACIYEAKLTVQKVG